MHNLPLYGLFGLLFLGGTTGYFVVTRALRTSMRIYEPRAPEPTETPSTAAPQV